MIFQVNANFYIKGDSNPVGVDVVCNHGFTWVKVIARKPQALHIVWTGEVVSIIWWLSGLWNTVYYRKDVV